MSRIYILCLLLALVTGLFSIDVYTDRDYYTNEKTIRLFWIDKDSRVDSLEINNQIYKSIIDYRKKIRAIEIPLKGLSDNQKVTTFNNGNQSTTSVQIKRLPDKLNAVKIDRIRGCLIVDDLIYLPSGFYTYSPVQSYLIEDEVVRGFNMISPYQKILPETRLERLEYLDDANNLGMKVNYNLLSVAGGGGVNLHDHDFSDMDRTLSYLKEEVEAIKDHPALMSWYISDEPYYTGTKPEYLEMIYNLIKEIDPYHPITIVFMKSAKAGQYSKALDIAMADPYPIPVRSVYEVEQVTHRLTNEFFPEKLVWNVPQTFGGSEWWRREPTHNELRAMLYLSLLNGASGYQFFIRKGLNGFPKSTQLWSQACNSMLEMQELVPWIFSGEENPEVSDGTVKITTKAFKKDNSIIIVSVNGENKPVPLTIRMSRFFTGEAEVLFENRSLDVNNGVIDDYLDVYGVRIYKIYIKNAPKLPRINDRVFLNHSFERNYVASVPAGCYANVGHGRGKIYTIDSRIATDGEHSLRMHVSPESDSFNLSFYPMKLDYGRDYYVSVKAKKERYTYSKVIEEKFKKSIFQKLFGSKQKALYKRIVAHNSFKIKVGKLSSSEYFLNQNWTKFSYIFNNIQESKQVGRISPRLIYYGPGTAWFDEFELLPLLNLCSNNREEARVITTTYTSAEAPLYYTLDGTIPNSNSSVFNDTLVIKQSSVLKLRAIDDNRTIAEAEQAFAIHKALDCKISIDAKISTVYAGNGLNTLTDGLLSGNTLLDYRNIGFEGNTMTFNLDLGEIKTIESVAFNFISGKDNDVSYPDEIAIQYSNDKVAYSDPHTVKVMIEDKKVYSKFHLKMEEENTSARYIKITITNNSSDEDTPIIMFDEIIVQ